MTDNMHNEMFNYLKSFMIENFWYDSHTPQQARSIFTTICMMNNIDLTDDCYFKQCDNMLRALWTCASVDELEIDYDEFFNFMTMFL